MAGRRRRRNRRRRPGRPPVPPPPAPRCHRRLSRSADRGRNEAAAVPPPAGAAAGATGDLHRAVTDAGRLWSARRRELEAVVAANEAVIASLPDPLLML